MQEINKWLTGSREFETGAKIYQKYGDNEFFKLLLKDGATPYNIDRLVGELEALAPPIPAIDDHQTNLPEEPPKVDLAQVECKIQIEAEIKRTYRQLDFNRAILTQSNDKTILHETAKQILKLRKNLMVYWYHINFFEENGHFPQEKQQKEYSKKEAIQYLRQSISKAKKRIKNMAEGSTQYEKTKQLIQENQDKIKVLGGKVK